MDETNIDLNAIAEATDQQMNDKEALMANLIGMYQHIMDQCQANDVDFDVLEDVAAGLWSLRTGINKYRCGKTYTEDKPE